MNCLDRAIKDFTYRDFYLGPPVRQPTYRASHELWVQAVTEIPAGLLHFRRILWPCPDGHFRSLEYAMQERIIEQGVAARSTDVCTNIPWRFFDRHWRRKPFDLRVKRILRQLREQRISRAAFRDSLMDTGFQGFPDALEFGRKTIRGWEIKGITDAVSLQQRTIHDLLFSVGIPVRILTVRETNRSLGEYQALRSSLREAAKQEWAGFWQTDLGRKIYNTLFTPALSTNRRRGWYPETSRRKCAEELRNVRTAPSSLVAVLSQYVEDYLENERYGLFRKELTLNGSEAVATAEALYKSGVIKWWKVPLMLVPFVTDAKEDSAFGEVLRLSVAWERNFRTEHMNVPDLSHYRSRLSGRVHPKEFRLATDQVLSSYRTIVRSNCRRRAKRRKPIGRTLAYLAELSGYSGFPMRDSYYQH